MLCAFLVDVVRASTKNIINFESLNKKAVPKVAPDYILFTNSVIDLRFPMDSLRQRKAASISARSRPIAQLDLAHVAPRSALERAVRQPASPDGVDCRTLRPKLTVEMRADHVLWPQRVRVRAVALHEQCVDVLDLARL